jgi:hypothetical protein
MMSIFSTTLVRAVAVAGLVFATPSQAVELITYAQFFQTNNVKHLSYTAAADHSTITVTGAPSLTIGLAYLISDPVGTLFPTTFAMSATSFSPVVATSTQFEQVGFEGTVSFTSGTTNVLTLHFKNAIFNYAFGDPASASMIVDCFCGITWSSDVFALPAGAKDFALGINALSGLAWSPALATWAMLIAGFGLVGVATRRRRTLAA